MADGYVYGIADECGVRYIFDAEVEFDQLDRVHRSRRMERHEGVERKPEHWRAYREHELSAHVCWQRRFENRNGHGCRHERGRRNGTDVDALGLAYIGVVRQQLESELERN
jgi:hypothetical protein